MLEKKIAGKISDLDAKLHKLSETMDTEGLTEQEALFKFFQEANKIEGIHQLYDEEKMKKIKKKPSKPITKEQLSQIIKKLEKYE